MILTWLAAAAAFSALATIATESTLRLVPRRLLARRWAWLALMIASAVIPIAGGFRVRAVSAPAAIALANESVAEALPPAAGLSLDAAVLAVWGAAAFALALLFAASHWRTLRRLRAWPEASLCDTPIRVTPDFGPAVVGFFRARVVLPQWVLELPDDERMLVLAHEQEHVRARDQLVLLLGLAIVVLLPWNPLLWWQLRRLRIGIELDCDARVASDPADRPRYGRILLNARVHSGRQRAGRPILAMAPPASALAERIDALVGSARLSPRQWLARSSSVAACAILATRVSTPDLTPLFRELAPPPASAPRPADTRPVGDSAILRQIPRGTATRSRATVRPPSATRRPDGARGAATISGTSAANAGSGEITLPADLAGQVEARAAQDELIRQAAERAIVPAPGSTTENVIRAAGRGAPGGTFTSGGGGRIGGGGGGRVGGAGGRVGGGAPPPAGAVYRVTPAVGGGLESIPAGGRATFTPRDSIRR